jgi:hypothetical protein
MTVPVAKYGRPATAVGEPGLKGGPGTPSNVTCGPGRDPARPRAGGRKRPIGAILGA